MSTLLKDRYSPEFVEKLAAITKQHWKPFNAAGYVATVFGNGWDEMELKQRMRRLSSTFHPFLPKPYPEQIEVLKNVATQFSGFEAMLFPDFVEQFGLDAFETSIQALEHFTQYSSSEFAVRPFIVRYGKRMMKCMTKWTKHPSEHVRRLASEGCRPRLPWAMALPDFKRDPTPILPILETLRDDPSEYVRRSVANNLNDISRDHPELVLSIAGQWLGTSSTCDAVVKHALRTLLKRGDQRALKLFGFRQNVPATISNLRFSPASLKIGENLLFSFDLSHEGNKPLGLRLEYAVDFVKSRGSTNRKVFKIAEGEYKHGETKRFERKHRFCDFTTRKHYAGQHRLSVLVNGLVMAEGTIELT